MSKAAELAALIGGTSGSSLSNRNLIINGAMACFQRAASSSTSQEYVADRFRNEFSGAGVTTSRETLSSGSPYDEGFRHFIRNSNTSVSSATSAYVYHVHLIEAQNIASSGWQYASASSYLTLQFWVRSSLAGTYYVLMETQDGSPNKTYSFTYTVSADTWTKVTHTFPGDSGITINNDSGAGYRINFVAYLGTDFSTSGHTNEAWQTFSISDLVGDFSQNWANTASATFDITGVQLEVGEQATPFEHRSFGDELTRCQRYYFKFLEGSTKEIGVAWYYTAAHASFMFRYPTTMRATPTATDTTGTGYYTIYRNAGSDAIDSVTFENGSTEQYSAYNNTNASGTAGQAGLVRSTNASAKIEFDAEL
jgi:hypothetical protein